MKLKTRLLLVATVLALAVPLILSGQAGAIVYSPDGALMNGTTGLWQLPAVFCAGVSDAYVTAGNYAANPGPAQNLSPKTAAACTNPAFITFFNPDPVGAACKAAGYQWRSGTGCYARFWTRATDLAGDTWVTSYGDINYRACLKCHNKYYMDPAFGGSHVASAGDPIAQYIKASHKNASRKIVPGQGLANVYAGTDGSDHFGIFPYVPAGAAQTAGPYGSTTTYNLRLVDWVNGEIEDTTGGLKNLPTGVYTAWYWEFGEYGVDPERGTYNGAVGSNGKPSAKLAACFRCHATGYVGFNTAPDGTKEPEQSFPGISWNGTTTYSSGTRPGVVNLENNLANRLLGANFNTLGTYTYGAWDQFGVLCSKCHNSFATTTTSADAAHNNGSTSGNASNPDIGLNVTTSGAASAVGPSVNAMCAQCHLTAGSSNWQVTLTGGDQIITDLVNVANTGHPNYDGEHFLNSPHARFSGTYGQIASSAQYNSPFLTTYGGCTGCHDPHGSVREALLDSTLMGANVAEDGLVETCQECHTTAQFNAYAITSINHPLGTGTPMGTIANPTDGCVTCHMSGSEYRHIFRITTDPTYTSSAPSSKPDDRGFAQALWVDVTSACLQCHNGQVSGAPVFTVAQASAGATGMHLGGSTETAAQCLACHAYGNTVGAPVIIPEDAATVPPGQVKNHHSGSGHASCTGCHGDAPHSGAMALNGGVSYATGPSGNAFCMSCHTNSGSHATHHVVPAVATAGLSCTTCHSVTPGSPGSQGYAGITPVWANLRQTDCLACHGSYSFGTSTNPTISPAIPVGQITPGTNHHGSFAWCTDCHMAEPMTVASNTGITEGPPTPGGPGTATKVNYATGTPGNAFCMNCHGNTGPYGTHHVVPELATAGKVCTNCHSVLPPNAGTEGYAGERPVWANMTQADCQACHTSALGMSTTPAISPAIAITAIQPGTNHHGAGTQYCTVCHTLEPLVPLPLTTNATCATCHSESMTAGNMKHQLGGAAPATCVACHQVPGPGAPISLPPACQQCHGGSGPGILLTPAQIAADATNFHYNDPVVSFTIGYGSNTMTASVNAAATTCSGTCGTYDWDWGDLTAHGSGVTATHTYATPATYVVKLTVTDSVTYTSASLQSSFTALAVVTPPTASGTYTPSPNTWSVSVTDTSTPGSAPISQISVSWGDALTSTGVAGATFNHTYALKGTYTITLKASSTSGSSTTTFGPFTAAPFSISGNVYKKGGTIGLGGAMLLIRSGANCSTSPVVTAVVSAATTGAYTTGLALKPGTYTLCASESGYTFNVPAATGITLGPNATQNITATGP